MVRKNAPNLAFLWEDELRYILSFHVALCKLECTMQLVLPNCCFWQYWDLGGGWEVGGGGWGRS